MLATFCLSLLCRTVLFTDAVTVWVVSGMLKVFVFNTRAFLGGPTAVQCARESGL